MAKLADKLDDDKHLLDAARSQRRHEAEVAELKVKLAKSESRWRLAEKELAESDAVDEFRRAIGGDGGAKLPAYKFKKPSGRATGVIAINDIHGEERVDPATINDLNDYTLEIAEQRISRVADNAITLIDAQRKLSHIKDLVVWIGGDIITGHIHEELAETSALSPIEACQWAKWQLIGLLDHWLAYVGCCSVVLLWFSPTM